MLNFVTTSRENETVVMIAENISHRPNRTADHTECWADHVDHARKTKEMALRWFAIRQLYSFDSIIDEGPKGSAGERLGSGEKMLSISDDNFWTKYERLMKG